MFQTQTVSVGATQRHAVIGPPNGPPLLLLHGFARQWRTFDPLIPALATQWQIHAIDFRGHGRSDRTPDHYRVVHYVEDARQYLATLDEPAVVYGHSLGSMVAAGVAATAPDKVRGILLEDPPLQTMGLRIAETPLLGFFRELHRFAGDDRPAGEIARDLAEIRLVNPQTKLQTRLGDVRDSASLRFTAGCLRRLDPDAFPPIIEGRWLKDFDIDRTFRGIRCPILLVQADPAAGGMLVDKDVEHLNELCDDLTHVKLNGVGHLIHWSHTPQLSSLVLSFLATIS